MTDKQQKYLNWLDRDNGVCAFTKEYGPKLNCHVACTQVKVEFEKDIDIMFLGFNPAEKADYQLKCEAEYRNRFLEGNIYTPEYWGEHPAKPAHAKWRWIFSDDENKPFAPLAKQVIPGNYQFMNIFYFGSSNKKEAIGICRKSGLSDAFRKCYSFTIEAIEIIQPKCVICFSIGNVFNAINSVAKEKSTTFKVKNGVIKKCNIMVLLIMV